MEGDDTEGDRRERGGRKGVWSEVDGREGNGTGGERSEGVWGAR